MKTLAVTILAIALTACSSYHQKLVVPCETEGTAMLADSRECVMFHGYQIETVGDDTVITWMSNGRRLVLRDLTGYSGAMTVPVALFQLGDARISVTEDHFRFFHPTYRVDALLADYEDEHLVLDDGVLTGVKRGGA